MIHFMHSVNLDLSARCFYCCYMQFFVIYSECVYVVITSLVFFLCTWDDTHGPHYIVNNSYKVVLFEVEV